MIFCWNKKHINNEKCPNRHFNKLVWAPEYKVDIIKILLNVTWAIKKYLYFIYFFKHSISSQAYLLHHCHHHSPRHQTPECSHWKRPAPCCHWTPRGSCRGQRSTGAGSAGRWSAPCWASYTPGWEWEKINWSLSDIRSNSIMIFFLIF